MSAALKWRRRSITYVSIELSRILGGTLDMGRGAIVAPGDIQKAEVGRL